MIRVYILITLLFPFLGLAQDNCYATVIPCDFPCSEYVIDENGCPVCECSDGWTPINEDGCYASNGVTYVPGDQFFITDCQYVNCLQVEDGWGGFLDSGIWSEVIDVDGCVDAENTACPNSVIIPSDSYGLFDDNLNQIDAEIMLLPILSSGDMSISSYQFNFIYNHQLVNVDLESFDIVNSSTFYTDYNLDSALSDVANGGMFSVNSIQLDSVSSILSIAYATSNIQSMSEILMYIPLIVSYQECFDLQFSDGYINGDYIYPNQTYNLLVSNQDLSDCAVDGIVCFTCIDENDNSVCDELEISGCMDETMFNYNPNATFDDSSCIPFVYGCLEVESCNYNPDANTDDGDCIFEGDSCYVVVANDCCCCGVCDCVCEQEWNDLLVCEGELTNNFEPPWNIVAQGEIENCECNANNLLGCTDELACNYNGSTIDDGSCEYLSCSGCIDALACNYDPDALIGDNSLCEFPNECDSCEDEELVQIIELPLGWSFFSTYLCPSDPSFEAVLVDLVNSNNLVIVKDEGGNIYWPQFNINTIGDIENGEAYLLKMDNPSTLSVYGNLLSYDYPINLSLGWSYLGYLHLECYNAPDMMLSVVDNLIIIKDENGSVYWPQFELNSLGDMCPGKGYQVKMNQTVNFSYPSVGRFGFSEHDMIEKPGHYREALNTGNNMTIGFPIDTWENIPNTGDEIAAYDESGNLIGSTVFNGDHLALTVWGDDVMTDNKDGLIEGEKILFRLWDSETNLESILVIDSWDAGSDIYEIDGISIASSIIIDPLLLDRKIVKVFDLLGRETDKKGFNIEMYNDGSVNKKYVVDFK